MMKQNKATITVRAFFSEKYFLIVFNLHGPGGGSKSNADASISLMVFGRTRVSID